MKKKKDPGPIKILLAAIGSILVGVLIASLQLAAQQPEKVDRMPAEEDRAEGTFYYIEGRESNGSSWREEQQRLLSGKAGAVSLSEGELNRWSQEVFKAPARGRASSAGDGGEEGKESDLLRPTPPNFRIDGGQLQISTYVPAPLVKYLSKEDDDSEGLLYVVKGHFEEDSADFVVDSAHLGLSPMPPVTKGLISLLKGRLYWSEEAEQVAAQWERVTEAKIADGRLILTLE